MSKTTSVKELRRLLQEKRDVVIVDVRRQSDYEADSEVIPGAVWRDPEKVEAWGKDLPEKQEVLIYCVRGGSVSQSVSKLLSEAKVNVSYIEGGFAAWKEAGGEVEPK
jgi:rhodanese-related sulfurtransferase